MVSTFKQAGDLRSWHQSRTISAGGTITIGPVGATIEVANEFELFRVRNTGETYLLVGGFTTDVSSETDCATIPPGESETFDDAAQITIVNASTSDVGAWSISATLGSDPQGTHTVATLGTGGGSPSRAELIKHIRASTDGYAKKTADRLVEVVACLERLVEEQEKTSAHLALMTEVDL